MNRPLFPTALHPFLGALLMLALAPPALQAQGPTGGLSREQMWPAPTAEDWAKPCLVTWQRTYEDAQAVSRETGKPILLCVNMDGEIASEHYAGIRYRQPEIATLYEPYVTVIASVYRHNPRDYDEAGKRILCPRFGSVTCGEHIAIEPGLYEEFFEGRRIAPRHIGVELDGEEMYDVYYAWDTDTIFNALRDGIADRPDTPTNVVRGDRPITERVASRDVRDRTAVEAAYDDGDAELRRALLAAALEAGDDAPLDMLRLAVFGFDTEMSALARQALARSSTPESVDLIAESLRVPMADGERDALIGALERLGSASPRARTLSVVHTGLARRSKDVDVENWARALQYAAAASPDGVVTAPEATLDAEVVTARLERQDEVLQGDDAAGRLDLAEAFLVQAYEQFADDEEYARYLFMDAQRAALEAEQRGADGWRVDAVVSIAAYYLDEKPTAYARAESAVASGIPDDADDWNSMAVLAIFAQARHEAISAAVREKRDWPSEWLTDVHAACSVLARHPFGRDEHVVAHYDFLRSLGGTGQAARVLDEGLARFPDSGELHARLRGRILSEQGIDGLEPAYERMLARDDASPGLSWFAGQAALVTAEFRRRGGNDAAARAAYDRAIAHYERDAALHPEQRFQTEFQIAVALGGRARIAYEAGDDDGAVADLVASIARRPEAADALDGLNISAVDTAKMVRARLAGGDREELAAQLNAALDSLDPAQLRLPAYENDPQGGGPSPDARRAAGRRRRSP